MQPGAWRIITVQKALDNAQYTLPFPPALANPLCIPLTINTTVPSASYDNSERRS